MKTILIKIPDELHKDIKLAAIDLDTTMTKVIIGRLEEFVVPVPPPKTEAEELYRLKKIRPELPLTKKGEKLLDTVCEHGAAKGMCKVSKCKFSQFNPKNK